MKVDLNAWDSTLRDINLFFYELANSTNGDKPELEKHFQNVIKLRKYLKFVKQINNVQVQL